MRKLLFYKYWHFAPVNSSGEISSARWKQLQILIKAAILSGVALPVACGALDGAPLLSIFVHKLSTQCTFVVAVFSHEMDGLYFIYTIYSVSDSLLILKCLNICLLFPIQRNNITTRCLDDIAVTCSVR